jgi:hypothetical protein
MVRQCGIPLDPLVEGVRQDSLENLERTLSALADLYESGRGASNRELQMACRRLVIEAKEHARWSLKRTAAAAPDAAARSSLKREAIEWLMVWLENPAIFPAWVRLRQQAMRAMDSLPSDH